MVTTDRYTKLTRGIPVGNITSTHGSIAFFEAWIISFDIPTHVLMDNKVQFTRKLFAALCTMLVVEHLKTTAYRAQTNGHRTIVTRLRHRVIENHRNC